MIDACADLARRIVCAGGNEYLDKKSPLEQKASVGSWLHGNSKKRAKAEVAGDQQIAKPPSVLVVIG